MPRQLQRYLLIYVVPSRLPSKALPAIDRLRVIVDLPSKEASRRCSIRCVVSGDPEQTINAHCTENCSGGFLWEAQRNRIQTPTHIAEAKRRERTSSGRLTHEPLRGTIINIPTYIAEGTMTQKNSSNASAESHGLFMSHHGTQLQACPHIGIVEAERNERMARWRMT